MTWKRTAWTALAATAAFLLGVVLTVAVPASGVVGAHLLQATDTHTLVHRVIERLELTPEQIEDIHARLREFAPQIHSRFNAVKEARQDQFAAIHQHPPVESEIRAAAAEVAAAEAEMAVLRSQVVDSLYQTLTPEQQAEWRQIEADVAMLVESVIGNIQEHIQDRLQHHEMGHPGH